MAVWDAPGVLESLPLCPRDAGMLIVYVSFKRYVGDAQARDVAIVLFHRGGGGGSVRRAS